jgi:hypothetical protein
MKTIQEKTQRRVQKKFRVWQKYQKLNRNDQRIVKSQMQKRFEVSEAHVYNILKNDNLTGDQLIFFAELFDCPVRDLYNQEPPKQRRINDLSRQFEEEMYNITTKLGLA